MRDPEFDAEPVSKPAEGPWSFMTPVDANWHLIEPSGRQPDGRRHLGWRSILLAGMTFLAACWLILASHSSRRYTCAVCREGKVENWLLGLSWSTKDETDCSRWYRDNVEPSHAHAWAGRGYCRPIGILGLGGVGCSIGSPITSFSEGEQIKIYEHFQDRLEAKRLFVQLARWDDESDRQWPALMGWINEGYPGTWHDWREKQRSIDE